MKVVEYKSGSTERQILTAMILNSVVLGRISSQWQRGMFASSWSNEIAEWCNDYYQKYGEAPAKAMVGLFQNWADRNQERKDDIRLIESLLESLSDEWETGAKDIRIDYITDVAGMHFNKNRVGRTISAAQGELDNGDLDAAVAKITNFKRLEMGPGAAIDLVQNEQEISTTFFQQESTAVINYPGAIGELFSNIFELDGFVAIRAPDKSGKSFVLLDLAIRAALQRQRVAYFQVGDMSQRQVLKRFYTRIAGIPIRSPDWPPKWPAVIKWPVSIEHVPSMLGTNGKNQRQPARIEYEEKRFKKPLDYHSAVKACEKFMYERIKSKRSFLRLSCHANSTMTVAKIKDTLARWEIEGYEASIVIIDYADILAPPEDRKHWDRRDLINENWNQMRALSQEKHVCLVTATQSDTETYRKEIQDRSNFSEDKRQNAHVSAMVAINQTDAEKEAGQYRLQVPFRREEDFSPRRCVHVASCLALAHPTVRSCWEPIKNRTK